MTEDQIEHGSSQEDIPEDLDNLQKKIAVWRKRLLDLGGRNRLIYFRETKTGCARIESPSPNSLAQRLIKEGKGLRLTHEGAGPTNEGEASISGDLEELTKSLYYLLLRSRTAQEEKGVNVLFVSLGFLHWYEAENSDTVIKSPLFLVPVTLKRAPADREYQFDYTVIPNDEGFVLNRSLCRKLENDFNIILDDILVEEDHEPEEVSIEELLAKVRRKVSGKARWLIAEDAYLGIFAYQKLPMYEDIGELEDRLYNHPLVKALAGVAEFEQDIESCVIDPRELDNEISPTETYEVLDTDSSQHQAVVAAKRGLSFKMHGPPGTGKSQTIANIIAEFLAAGKTILFVSAKMAALQVVWKRLDEVGLGRFCLEMHSGRANKKHVYEQLKSTWDTGTHTMTEAELEQLLQLGKLRNELNEYFKALQTPQTKLDHTPYEVHGKLAQLLQAPSIRCKVPDPDNITRDALRKIEDILGQIGRYPQVFRDYENHPWFGCTLEYLGFNRKEEINELLSSLVDILQELADKVEYLRQFVPLKPETIEDVSNVVEIGKRYCLGILSEDLKHLLFRFESDFKTWKRYLLPSYYQSMRIILNHLRSDVYLAAKGLDIFAYRQAIADLKHIINIINHLGSRLGKGGIGSTSVESDSLFDSWTKSTDELLQSLHQKFEEFSKIAFENTQVKVDGLEMVKSSVSGLAEWVTIRKEGIWRIDEWINFRKLMSKANNLGLKAFLSKAITQNVLAMDLTVAFKKRFFTDWLDIVYERSPSLQKFGSEEFNNLRQEFKQLDKIQLKIARKRIEQIVTSKYPKQSLGHTQSSETTILLREAAKQRAHMPIRRLFSRIPALLLRLKPCLMMSPLTVSMYFKGSQMEFDLAIFDEASQVLPEDALPSIVRAKQVIVAGDEKQLPPTDFFRALQEDSMDEVIDEISGFESILDLCSGVLQPQLLNWHYRSQHEDLIAFSNHHFYDNRLQVFPSSDDEEGSLGVSFINVEGIYDASKSRTNKKEAREIAKSVIAHAKKMDNDSLGVVAFSESQQMQILMEIETLRRENPELNTFFDRNGLEYFFVKNLENVQGDERDVMFFSIGYGPNRLGEISRNFGPINRLGGERRLNVAVTRARKAVRVFSSMRAADIDTTGLQSKGPFLLKAYLDYAEHGAESIVDIIGSEGKPPQSPFEEAVIAALRDRGHDVVPQVGCSRFVIDIAVKDMNKPGRYVLGIECDGATYHSSYTARERDRLRQEVLEKKYRWRIHRIWSRDWLMDPANEIAKVEAAIKRATTNGGPDELDEYEEDGGNDNENPPLVSNPPWQSSPEFWGEHSVYREARLHDVLKRVHLVPSRDSLYNKNAELQNVVYTVVEIEGPITIDRCMQRVAKLHGINNVGSRVRLCIDLAIERLKRKGVIKIKNGSLWPKKLTSKAIKPRLQPDGSNTRKPDEIPIEELAAAAKECLEDMISIDKDDLVIEVARLFKFQHTGRIVKDRVNQAIYWALRKGIIISDGNRLMLKPN